jgi:hypothetical protein
MLNFQCIDNIIEEIRPLDHCSIVNGKHLRALWSQQITSCMETAATTAISAEFTGAIFIAIGGPLSEGE